MSNTQSLTAIATDIINDLRGGSALSTDSRFPERQVMEKIRQYRAVQIQDYHRKSLYRTIDPLWQLDYTCTYDVTIQDSKACVKFAIPKVLYLDKNAGISVFDPECFRYFNVLQNPMEFGIYSRHRYTKPTMQNIMAWYDGTYLCVAGEPLMTTVSVRIVADNPLDFPGFDQDEDDYPVSAFMIPLIKEGVKKEMLMDLQVPQDTVNDGTDLQVRTR